MIVVSDGKLIIEVTTPAPDETLSNYVKSILSVMKLACTNHNKINPDQFYFLIELLEEIIPDTAGKRLDK